jgi:hypothetical protein
MVTFAAAINHIGFIYCNADQNAYATQLDDVALFTTVMAGHPVGRRPQRDVPVWKSPAPWCD